MKVYALPAGEDWICDQLVKDWNQYSNLSTTNIAEADICWLLSDWCWKQVPIDILRSKLVITTIHHIVPSKFNQTERAEFAARDQITDVYHVYNFRTLEFVKTLTKKHVELVPYWANQYLWKKTDSKENLRKKYSLPLDVNLIGSFQRDTEGSDLISPKLEKGPDILADWLDYVHSKQFIWQLDPVPGPSLKLHVLLAGWRRQYIISRLEKSGISYTYFERPNQQVLNDLYQTLDLYAVTARHEGAPQSLLEGGLLGVKFITTPVGIAEQVLPMTSINENIDKCLPCIPYVEHMKLPHGINQYEEFFQKVYNGTIK